MDLSRKAVGGTTATNNNITDDAYFTPKAEWRHFTQQRARLHQQRNELVAQATIQRLIAMLEGGEVQP